MIDKSDNSDLPWTGERYLPQVDGVIELEHYHRYSLILKACENKRVLDIASGEGYGSNLISSVASEVIGVDVSKEAVWHASKKYISDNLSFVCGSADSIPFPDDFFDIIVSFETIEHHEKHAESIAEYKRVLKPTGNLIISSPNKLNYSDKTGYSNPYHVLELYREDFINLISCHFKNYSIYGQKVIMCSMIVNESGNGLELWKDKRLTGDFEPIYDVIVAGDFDLQQFKSSIFELMHPDGGDYIAHFQKLDAKCIDLVNLLDGEKKNSVAQIEYREEVIRELRSRLDSPLVKIAEKIVKLFRLRVFK